MKHHYFGAALFLLSSLLAGCGGSPGEVVQAPVPAAEDQPISVRDEEPEQTVGNGSDTEEAEKTRLERHYGKFVKYDLYSAKPVEAGKFYEQLLGWTVTATPDQGRTRYVIENGGRELAHIIELDPTSAIPAGWMSWISVENIVDMMRDVPANGGEILVAPYAGDQGRLAVVKGPTGGIFGVVELRENAAPDAGTGSGDLVLSQLWTDNFEVAQGFYSVIGLYTSIDVTHQTTKYSILLGEGVPRALIRLAPDGRTTRWIPFVMSSDVDKHAKAARSLGAKIITQARDIPSLGRVAVVEAPAGGIIGFVTPGKWDAKSNDDND